MIVVGLDPGVTTGFAVWLPQTATLREVTSLPIHRAMVEVRALHELAKDKGGTLLVIFEDARTLKFPGGRNAKKEGKVLQGVGSVKRDCGIWEDFCEDYGIPYQAKRWMRGTTKWTAEYFKRLTGWAAQTNEHARDAGVLVFGLNLPICAGIVRTWQDEQERKKKSTGKSSPAASMRARLPSPPCPTAGAE